jgi:hypothetical protein
MLAFGQKRFQEEISWYIWASGVFLVYRGSGHVYHVLAPTTISVSDETDWKVVGQPVWYASLC